MVNAPNAGFVRTSPTEGPERVTATSRSETGLERARADLIVETVRFDEHRALVKASGEIDLSTGALLWAVLDTHVAMGRRFLRLDLSGVTFMDATAISGVARVHHELLDRRGTLVLTGVRPRIAKLLRLTGLDGVLLIGGPRADDDLEWASPKRFPAQLVPWTPLTAARRNRRDRNAR
jgi:anti-sigma B factor antagonist